MSEALATLSVPTTHRQFVALSPTDLPVAQHEIASWCKAKIQELGTELREQRQNFRQAKAAKWKHSSWQTAVLRTKRRMIYYAKIAAAVREGYLIVPNFDVEVMAIRTDQARVPSGISGDVGQPLPRLLPPGAGRYIGPQYQIDEWKEDYKDSSGRDQKRRLEQAKSFTVPEFPAVAVKPLVLAATQRAMALKLFDDIGVVTGRKKDPVVIGRLWRDKPNRWSFDGVSFFIAWWLDTRML